MELYGAVPLNIFPALSINPPISRIEMLGNNAAMNFTMVNKTDESGAIL